MPTQVSPAQYSLCAGSLPAGPLNKITDVPGVTVGHCTIDTPRNKTGVTVIQPCPGNPFTHKLPAAAFVLNGFGKTAGLIQVDELGTLETPIALTNTLNVGLVHDALVEHMVRLCVDDSIPLRSVNPIVAECNDGGVNDIACRAVQAQHVFAAFEDAKEDFPLGDIGAGKGMVCHGLKGGIGSASRVLTFDGKDYLFGALVLANHGCLSDLTISGHRIGPDLALRITPIKKEKDLGSCIVVFATNIPLSSRQLGRVARRASVGLARLGSCIGHGSGEVFIAFSTANPIPHDAPAAVLPASFLHESCLDTVFRAAADTTEESILSALLCADSLTGFDGVYRYSLRELLGWRGNLPKGGAAPFGILRGL